MRIKYSVSSKRDFNSESLSASQSRDYENFVELDDNIVNSFHITHFKDVVNVKSMMMDSDDSSKNRESLADYHSNPNLRSRE